jgi:hypothetical protein
MVSPLKQLDMHDMKMMSASLCFWTCLQIVILYLPVPFEGKYKQIKPKEKFDVQNRFVSAIHGTVLMLGAGYEFYFLPRQCGDANNELEKSLIYIASGYFTYDVLCMTWYGLLDWAMFLHHLFATIGMVLSLCSGSSACLVIWGMFIGEISNPPMHLRVILKHIGLRYTKAYEILEITFITLYAYSRMFCGSWVTYRVCLCDQLHFMQKVTAFFIMAQTFHFIGVMFGILKKRYSDISLRKAKGIKMRWFSPLNKQELEILGINPTAAKDKLSL